MTQEENVEYRTLALQLAVEVFSSSEMVTSKEILNLASQFANFILKGTKE